MKHDSPLPRCLVLVVLTLLGAKTTRADFNYSDFSSTGGLNLVGTAAQSGSNVRLTPASANQAGAAWHAAQQQIVEGFSTTFTFRITSPGGTADASGQPGGEGFAFVIQNQSETALGGHIGDDGLTRAISVEFDTWQANDPNDPNSNHISILTQGQSAISSDYYWVANTGNAVLPDFSDGAIHTVKIEYTAGVLSVYIDNLSSAVLTFAYDISKIGLNNNGAWVGFVAGCEDAYENHDILQWSFRSTPSPSLNWIAGRDLLANEKPDGVAQETTNPNQTVPEWSYGYRGTLADTSLAFFTAADHTNAADGVEELEGWSNGDRRVAVNVSNALAGPTVTPGEMLLYPQLFSYTIVRWTAPAGGTYVLTGFWQDMDFSGGAGASAHIVINGGEIFGQTFDNTEHVFTTQTVVLSAGDVIDFAVGAGLNNVGDATRFNAIVTPTAPTPQVWIAGRDLATNEKPDAPDAASTELSNPNGQVPQWAYGRIQADDLDFAISGASRITGSPYHTNAYNGYEDLEGWAKPEDSSQPNGSKTGITVNVGDAPIAFFTGGVPIQPDEISIFGLFYYAAIEWRAIGFKPGTYDVLAYWQDCAPAADGNFFARMSRANTRLLFGADVPFGAGCSAAMGVPTSTVIDFGVRNTLATKFDAAVVRELGGRSANISTRGEVLTGDKVMIGGFVVQGAAGSTKKVIIRAIGPSLTPFGINNALADPVLELHDGTGAIIASNNNWRQPDANRVAVEATGLPPGDDNESAIVAELLPGAYTAILHGFNGGTGVALLEVYDLEGRLPAAQLGNISTRAEVGINDNVVIAGFIISVGGRSQIVIRGIGPSLDPYLPPAETLDDPFLELHDGNGTVISTNDNWRDTQESTIQATGLAPSNDLESAIVLGLNPGAYTAILKGTNKTTGIGLVEVYNLQ